MLVQTEINEIDNILNINSNGLIIAFSNSNEEKKNFVSNIVSNMVIKHNTSVAVLNSSIGFRGFINACIGKPIYKDVLKEFKNRIKSIANSNLLVNFASSYNLNELIEKCKYVKTNKNVKLIVIDKIDTIIDFKDTQTEIFSKLKELSTTLNVCILCVC